ncbi:bifunctional PIG-L family deacetylase/class I SAM-dependent methyltransferase [Aestuariimicrobium sp. p3-SID1156]|uniref:bifunctional PIG-L family deacetylase/class I SAM-dependent methyltransferase n=1 Tax=Aestuariimicrobium sp. p3-SID1156 TaxID=2916038 RepID=UPI00223ABE9E|nr:bifunctional PIG-L family deacetylase/class I SAM-dependent methyltransferase [Aestuariimicrobium sp. p3-SID1156]MCT1458152.1 bifunctional PIG-L family deacetylase/class I SAM-dependent methyltransferase [Aestuariimicrobium sp. p3-SID1156]
MSADFRHRDAGTAEQNRLDSPAWAALPRLGPEVLAGVRRALVLAAHPDDETLGAGGLIASLRESGAQVEIITAGVLRLPDGQLADHCEELVAELRQRLDGVDLLVAPWRHDGDADRNAYGWAAARVAHERAVRLLEYPIWWWHRGDTYGEWPGSAVRVDLSGDEVLLGEHVLAHSRRDAEVFFLTEPGQRVAVEMEQLHAASPDPWGAEDRWYEERKRAVLLASLPRRRFARALEVGCSAGRLSLDLAGRVDELVARDVSTTAVAAASRQLAGTRADVAWSNLPRDWPAGSFDLVVLSETGYFFSPRALEEFLQRVAGSLAEDGVLVACHWMHPIEDWELDGIDVHQRLAEADFLTTLAQHREEDFWLDVFVRPPAVSVARAEGVV